MQDKVTDADLIRWLEIDLSTDVLCNVFQKVGDIAACNSGQASMGGWRHDGYPEVKAGSGSKSVDRNQSDLSKHTESPSIDSVDKMQDEA